MAEKATIARPYAKAIFDIARERQHLKAWSDMLRIAARTVTDPQVESLLDSPHVTTEQLVELIATPCRAHAWEGSVAELGLSFLGVLAQNRRLNVLPEISEIFDDLKADVERVIEITLTSAKPVSPDLQKKFAEALTKRFGREVHLQCETDEKLIGGALIRAEDIVIDGSVRGKLEKLAVQMTH